MTPATVSGSRGFACRMRLPAALASMSGAREAGAGVQVRVLRRMQRHAPEFCVVALQEIPMSRIVTLTLNPAMDLSTTAARVEPTRKLRCSLPHYDPGGGGINVARVVATLGGDALAVYPGGGPFGDLLERTLAGLGVPQRRVPIAGDTRESFTVDEGASGLQYRFVLPGPELSAVEQQACLDAIAALDPRHQGDVPCRRPTTGEGSQGRQLIHGQGGKLPKAFPTLEPVRGGQSLRELSTLPLTPGTAARHPPPGTARCPGA